MLSSVRLAYSWSSINTFWMYDWINPLWFLWMREETVHLPFSMCALYRNHSIWQACSLGKSHTGFVSTGYDHWGLCFPGSLRDQAALVIRLSKWGIKHTKPLIPVIPVEGKWFLLEGVGGTGRGGEGRGIHPLFSVLSSPFICFLFLIQCLMTLR